MIEGLTDEEKRLLLKKLLPEAVKLLSEDDATASHHTEVEFDIESLIPDIGDEYQQYFGDVVTIHKNRQGTQGHPKSFLCYITIPEAKLLRSLGLGYSLNPDTDKWEQHLSKDGIPSFQGGDGGASGGSSGGSSGGGGGRGAGFSGADGLTGGVHGNKGFSAARAGGYSFGMGLSSESSDDSSVDSTSLSWGDFKALEAQLGMTGYGEQGLGSDVTSQSVWGNATSFSFNAETMSFSAESSFSRTSNSLSATAYGTGTFGLDSFSYSTYDNPLGSPTSSFTTGFLGSLLGTTLSLSPQTSVTVGEIASAALAVALGSPIGALSPMAKAMEAQGLIGSSLSKGLQAAGLIGQFMGGMISSVQAYGAISQAKSMGAISNMQAAVLGAVSVYGMLNSMSSLQSGLSSLGFGDISVSMSEYGFSVNGDNLYIDGMLVTSLNYNSVTSSYLRYIASKNSYSYQDPEFDTFSKMAGSILLNNYLAGGTMWNPMNLVGGNYNNAVGISNSFSTFTQMTMLQNDYVGAVLAKNPN